MISVIIPTLNEAPALPALLTALQDERAEHETIVVDCGSWDGTVEIARRRGARVLQPTTGRVNQALRRGPGLVLVSLIPPASG
jgi:glycosyltransferase involved in cell wall biosynthesis